MSPITHNGGGMGAVEAFSRTITLITKAKKLYIPIFILTLIIAPLSAYLAPPYLFNPQNTTVTHRGNVIVEEHGVPSEEIDNFKGYIEKIALIAVLVLVLASLIQYGIMKGALEYARNGETKLGKLIMEGLAHFPGVFLINLFYGLLGLVMILLSMVPIGLGFLALSEGGFVLVLIGGVLLILVVAFMGVMSLLGVVLYVDKGNFGAAFEAIGIVFKNLKSSTGFGLLLMLAALVVGFVSATVSLFSLAFPEGTAKYVSTFLEAPFEALIYEIMWVGGVAFYLELQRREEMKKFEEEMRELGIEL
jgi:hypothetical protein